jgi:uncharacterized membrane protein
MIGTIMVGNVFRVIIPSQRNLVKAIAENREPDPALPAKGLLRSRHNNYLTLPVLFIMISNHFPSTYGSEFNWLILSGLAVFSILVRHYFNTRHGSQKFAWTVPVAALGMITLAYVTSPLAQQKTVPTTQPAQVVFTDIKSVIEERCTVCHSGTPTHPAFQTAPGGVILDTADDIKLNVPRIMAQAVQTQVMPLGNLTQMTDDERTLIGTWVEQGAATQ